MAARRGKSQARRNNGNSGSLPGWAWMVLGIVLTVGVILAAPKFLKGDGEDGFFRPRANPDAQPVDSATGEDAEGLVDGDDTATPRAAAADDASRDEPDYDFYDLLPGEEVAMTDAQLAAAAREEAERARRDQERLAAQRAVQDSDAAAGVQPRPLPESPAAPTAPNAPAGTPSTAPATAAAATAPAAGSDTPYILQAGAFGASGDAEAVKAKIALLGLNARVESAQIGGKTVYRVRMGPYGTASELAGAKGKLANGGLPALAIKAK